MGGDPREDDRGVDGLGECGEDVGGVGVVGEEGVVVKGFEELATLEQGLGVRPVEEFCDDVGVGFEGKGMCPIVSGFGFVRGVEEDVCLEFVDEEGEGVEALVGVGFLVAKPLSQEGGEEVDLLAGFRFHEGVKGEGGADFGVDDCCLYIGEWEEGREGCIVDDDSELGLLREGEGAVVSESR